MEALYFRYIGNQLNEVKPRSFQNVDISIFLDLALNLLNYNGVKKMITVVYS
jgi:hypothetical protein